MEKLLNGQVSPALVGLLQAAGVAIYCAAVGAFMFYMERGNVEPGYFGVLLILVLLVFSAAVTGSLIFALPVYLAMNQKIKQSLSILAYTLLFSFVIILLIMALVFVVV